MNEGAFREHEALVALGRSLLAEGYRFTTVTPETHAIVVARGRPLPRSREAVLRDAFGWSMPFEIERLPPAVRRAAEAAGVLVQSGSVARAEVRFSTLEDRIFVHSAFPTDGPHDVFFGPDTHRFWRLVARETRALSPRRAVDVGCGSGAVGILLATRCPEVLLLDSNPAAIACAKVNAAVAGSYDHVRLVHASEISPALVGAPDLVVANPPYIADSGARVYRDGGDGLGTAVALRMLEQAVEVLAPGGTLVLYTGAPFVDGDDAFAAGAGPTLERSDLSCRYEELDPDVFGSELARNAAYRDVERIAAVSLVVTKAKG